MEEGRQSGHQRVDLCPKRWTEEEQCVDVAQVHRASRVQLQKDEIGGRSHGELHPSKGHFDGSLVDLGSPSGPMAHHKIHDVRIISPLVSKAHHPREGIVRIGTAIPQINGRELLF